MEPFGSHRFGTARSGSWRVPAAVLLALYILLYVVPLGVRPLLNPDEARYAEIPREMLVSGDWVSPHFNGVRYFEKPVLSYWLDAASLRAFGETGFAVRLPSAIAAGFTALIVFFLTASFATRFAAYLAAAVYLSMLLVLAVGTTAVTDALLALFLTAALAAYYFGYTASQPRRRNLMLALCGACCAGAFLTKGFLALAIPVLVVGPYLAVRRDWHSIARTAWLPIVTATVLVLPWALLIAWREPDFWHYFFWVEHVRRFLSSDAQHSQPFWFFMVYGPMVAFPWSALLPASVLGLKRGPVDRPFVWYLVAWVVFPLLFFSASSGKLLTYILPIFAPLAVLMGIGLERYFAAASKHRALSAGLTAIVLLLVSMIALLAAFQWGTADRQPFSPAEMGRLFELFAWLAGGLLAAICALFAQRLQAKVAAVAAVGIATFMPLQLALLPQQILDSKAPAGYLAEEIDVGSGTILIADARLFGAVSWAFKRDDVYVVSPGEIAYGLAYPESRDRYLGPDRLAAFVASNRDTREIVLICRDSTAAALPPSLFEGAERRQRADVVMLRL